MKEANIDQLANVWIYYYICVRVTLKALGPCANVIHLIQTMDALWEEMEELIPDSHMDEINSILKNHNQKG